jgi:hypothetical protein
MCGTEYMTEKYIPAMANIVICRRVTADACIPSNVSQYWIFYGYTCTGTGTGISRGTMASTYYYYYYYYYY